MIICQDLLCNRKAYLLWSRLDSLVIGFTWGPSTLSSSSSESNIMFIYLQLAKSRGIQQDNGLLYSCIKCTSQETFQMKLVLASGCCRIIIKFSLLYENEGSSLWGRLTQPDVHSTAFILAINEQGLRVIAWRCCNEVDWINFVLTKMRFLSWHWLIVLVQWSCMWPCEEEPKSCLVRNSISEKNWCLYVDPNPSNTDNDHK